MTATGAHRGATLVEQLVTTAIDEHLRTAELLDEVDLGHEVEQPIQMPCFASGLLVS